MIKLILVFFVLALGFGMAVQTVRRMNNLEKWDLTKTLAFSIMCSLGAIVFMMAIVVLF
jgi:hypothetical protein